MTLAWLSMNNVAKARFVFGSVNFTSTWCRLEENLFRLNSDTRVLIYVWFYSINSHRFAHFHLRLVHLAIRSLELQNAPPVDPNQESSLLINLSIFVSRCLVDLSLFLWKRIVIRMNRIFVNSLTPHQLSHFSINCLRWSGSM